LKDLGIGMDRAYAGGYDENYDTSDEYYDEEIMSFAINEQPIDVRVIDRGESPIEGENYLVVRVYAETVEVVRNIDMYATTEVIKKEYGYSTNIQFCGCVTDVFDPEGVIDPYFHDLSLGKIITVHTPGFDFDIDGVEGEIPKVGDYICGDANIMGILIRKEKAKSRIVTDEVKQKGFMGIFTSLCTVITENYLMPEILQNPERFLSSVFQGREDYVKCIFNRGADIIGCEHFEKNDFCTELFPLQNGEAICAVIKLPGVREEFDYSVIAVKVCRDISKTSFYALEKGDENTYLLRKVMRTGESSTVNIVSNVAESEHFEYVCNYLRN